MTADVSGVKSSIRPQTNPKTGVVYYNLYFDVVLLFGLTELKAQIAWIENVSLSPPHNALSDTRFNRAWKNGMVFLSSQAKKTLNSKFSGPASIVYDIASTIDCLGRG